MPGPGGLDHGGLSDRGPGGAGVVVRADPCLVAEVDRPAVPDIQALTGGADGPPTGPGSRTLSASMRSSTANSTTATAVTARPMRTSRGPLTAGDQPKRRHSQGWKVQASAPSR